jgi:hypothetical protein
MEEVAEEGAADRDKAVEAVGALNAQHLQTMAVHKVSEALAGAKVAIDCSTGARGIHSAGIIIHVHKCM